jgi:hypothetical protein
LTKYPLCRKAGLIDETFHDHQWIELEKVENILKKLEIIVLFKSQDFPYGPTTSHVAAMIANDVLKKRLMPILHKYAGHPEEAIQEIHRLLLNG